ncbi:3-phenylpropionate/trans-cinnamate dioxygenase ferredoxin subunit [Motilibacter rhizosphaerae]|uniref:3-phenylpropionate/trans-cinnamate dioxygenase ferredoxin subunit n=1 Tax=Motilibacter rhizosphaerae TaxID=598652 RepID=A0A4Q7NG54_9ACTN|nr:non-heme iron oxygenase ferredoxin subunit [Motilibacter rhizosphaerae]RZS82792.1 3-phenylpropionate/trans-cinnamate dioxygenase ferredoxin subunit [Motilibacter rhizosphaerae]
MTAVRVTSLAELPLGSVRAFVVGGSPVVLAHVEEGVLALQDRCSHGAVKLSEGELDGCTLECWLHGSRFDLRTGKPSGPPAVQAVATYAVRVEGDDVLVDLATPAS